MAAREELDVTRRSNEQRRGENGWGASQGAIVRNSTIHEEENAYLRNLYGVVGKQVSNIM